MDISVRNGPWCQEKCKISAIIDVMNMQTAPGALAEVGPAPRAVDRLRVTR